MVGFKLQPFRPAPGLTNPHVQTLVAHLRRPSAGVTYDRVRLDTPDGDFVDLDLAQVDGLGWGHYPAGSPIVLSLHGLEGSARQNYSCELYRQLAWRGLRGAGLNFRSCSGELNRTTRLYHAGATDDVALALAWLRDRYPAAPLGLAGFSLGANLTLKYLGEAATAGQETVEAAVAVSPPFDLAAGAICLGRGLGRLYSWRFVWSLQAKVRARQAALAPLIDVPAALAARTLFEFDERATAPLHGFRDAADYYRQCSAGRFLESIDRPTLILRAADDPFFGDDIPAATLAANPFLLAGIVAHGGHVAFVGPRRRGHLTFWAETQAARFLAARLAPTGA